MANETDMTDAELLKSFIERKDQAAFEDLVRSHGPVVAGVCRRILKNHHDAEDAFQATFLVLARKAASISRTESLANWLYKVAYNTALNAQVANSKRRRREQPMTEVPESAVPDQNRWADLEPILDRELCRLPDKYRIPLVLCDLQGKTRHEAAAELGWPEATVSTRLAKARSLLTQRFVRQGFVFSAGTLAVLLAQNAASAAVPTSLVVATSHAATLFAGGNSAMSGAVSSHAAALTKGVLKSMLLAKIKLVAVVLIAVTAVTAGIEFQPQAAQPAVTATGLPAEIQDALEQNAKQLAPVSIRFTHQLKTQLPESEVIQRVSLSAESRPPVRFDQTPHRNVWQDPKFYASVEHVAPTFLIDGGNKDVKTQIEWSFDGERHSRGTRYDDARKPGFVTKKLKSQGRIGETSLHAMSSPYFKGLSGLSFRQNGDDLMALVAQSDIIGRLREGGTLLSVENVILDERPCVKIEIVTENAAKRRAESEKLEDLGSPTMDDGNGGKLEVQLTPEVQAEMIENLVRQRDLPNTRRFVYYLDPALHYAMRRREEWYDPDRLLLRCDCHEFEKMPDRPVWLPRRCEKEIHEFERHFIFYFNGPGRKMQMAMTLSFQFDDAFLSEVIDVSELDGKAVPEEQFELNYTVPGMRIQDQTLPESKQAPRGSVNYVIGRTAEETQRNKEAALRGTPDAPTVPVLDSAVPVPVPVPVPAPQPAVRWFLIVNLLAALIIGVIFLYRRSAK